MSSGSPTPVPLVLIVDDNETNRKLAREVLRAGGFGTVEAGTGAEAIAVACERLPDLILLDLGLPDMVGTDAARALRDRPQTADIPIVALSASLGPGNHDWLLEAGFAGILSKPIDVGAFPDQVRRFCKPHRS